jgi:hypothetical protein
MRDRIKQLLQERWGDDGRKNRFRVPEVEKKAKFLMKHIDKHVQSGEVIDYFIYCGKYYRDEFICVYALHPDQSQNWVGDKIRKIGSKYLNIHTNYYIYSSTAYQDPLNFFAKKKADEKFDNREYTWLEPNRNLQEQQDNKLAVMKRLKGKTFNMAKPMGEHGYERRGEIRITDIYPLDSHIVIFIPNIQIKNDSVDWSLMHLLVNDFYCLDLVEDLADTIKRYYGFEIESIYAECDGLSDTMSFRKDADGWYQELDPYDEEEGDDDSE